MNEAPVSAWVGIAIVVGGLAAMLAVLRVLRARFTLHAELLRLCARIGYLPPVFR